MNDLETLQIAAGSGVVEQGVSQSSMSRLTFCRGFWLPLTHLLRPRAMGAALVGCPAAAQTLSLLAGLAFLSLTVFGLVIFEDGLSGNGFAETLARHVRGHNRADGQAALFGAPLGFVGISLILAVLRFPGLHRNGSVWQTLARGLRSSLLLVWLAAILIVVSYFVVIAVDYELRRVVPPSHRHDAEGILALTGVSLLFWGLVWWVRQLDEGMVSRTKTDELPMVCEGCGYQLVDEQAEAVCSECGRVAADSLLPGRSRRTPDWEARPVFLNWLKSTWSNLLMPTEAYRMMPMRSGMRASGRFLIMMFLAIGVGAYGWFFTVYCMVALLRKPATPGRFDWVEALAIPMVPGCVCPLVGWLWHRGIGAIVALGVAWQAPLRDGRWLLKLLNYESCFLLAHCAFNGSLLTVFILASKQFEAFMHAVTGMRGIGGVPWGVVIMLLGNLALGAVWVARYGRTVRAIRWNNF